MFRLAASLTLFAAAANAQYGVACVDSLMVDVFGQINECRTATSCEATTDYAANVVGGGDVEKFTQRMDYYAWNASVASVTGYPFEYGVVTSVFADQGQMMSDLADYVAVTGPMNEMIWSEGLASASAEYTQAWRQDTSISTLTTTAGTTTSSRAGSYGTVDGLITESAYFYTSLVVDATDLMRILITNEGTSVMAEALFSTDAAYLNVYQYIGASYAVDSACTMSISNACQIVFDVVVAAGYTNDSGTAECNTTVDYGGGLCDPDERSQSLFEAINAMRAEVELWAAYIDENNAQGAALISACSTYQCTADYNGDGTATARTYVRYNINIQAAYAAMIAQTGNLDALTWEPGLYFAAAEQTTYCANQTSCSTTGANGSSSASRVSPYGQAGDGFAEAIQGNTDTVQWIVLDIIIDDMDLLSAGRTALLSSASTQAGVSSAENATLGYVYSVVIDSDFVADAQVTCAVATTTVEPDTAAGLIVAGTVALASALLM